MADLLAEHSSETGIYAHGDEDGILVEDVGGTMIGIISVMEGIIKFRQMLNPDEMNPIGILKAIKKAGIRAGSGFMIGFPDESWESIVKTKEFVKELFAEGLDQAGFAIPVPYPGTLDFEREMKNPEIRKNFNENLLEWTDHMHMRGRPLFPTKIPAADLESAVKDFWLEVNSTDYVNARSSMNISKA